MLKHLWLCVYANFIIANATHEKRSAYLKHRPELDGFLCKDYIFKLKSDSPIQCGLFCQANKLCDSVFFEVNSNTCTGCEPNSDENLHEIEIVTQPTLAYARSCNKPPFAKAWHKYFAEVYRSNPGSTTATSAKTSASDQETLSPSGKTHVTTTADSLMNSDSLRTNDFPTSTGTALSTTSDFSTTPGFTTITDSATTKDYFRTSGPFNTPPVVPLNLTLSPGQSYNTDDDEGIAWSTSKYFLISDVDFAAAEIWCANRKVSQDGHIAWVESKAENEFLANLVDGLTNNFSSIDEVAFLGVQVDSMNVLSLVPSGRLQAEVYKRSTKSPNYGKGNCVAIQSTGDWLVMDCSEIIAAICEV